jgi:hypothetical protein
MGIKQIRMMKILARHTEDIHAAIETGEVVTNAFSEKFMASTL